jgi:hypothetical protein
MNKTKRILIVCAIACVAIAGRSDAQKKTAADLTGTWQIHFQDDNGMSTSNPKLVLQQSGDKLTGTFGKFDWPVIGAIDGNNVVFTFVAHIVDKGKPVSDTVFYWGTVDAAAKAMKGRMKNPKEAGDWVAMRN